MTSASGQISERDQSPPFRETRGEGSFHSKTPQSIVGFLGLATTKFPIGITANAPESEGLDRMDPTTPGLSRKLGSIRIKKKTPRPTLASVLPKTTSRQHKLIFDSQVPLETCTRSFADLAMG